MLKYFLFHIFSLTGFFLGSLCGQSNPERLYLYKTERDTNNYSLSSHIEVIEKLPKTKELIRIDIDDRDKISRSKYTHAECIEILGEYLTFKDDKTKSDKRYQFKAAFHMIPPDDTTGFTVQIEALFSFTWMLTIGYPPIRPTLVDRLTGQHLNQDKFVINEVFEIYTEWLEENKKSGYKNIRLPLEGTPYAWLGEENGLKNFTKTLSMSINWNYFIEKNKAIIKSEYSGQTRPVIPDESRPLSNER
jgi:hypothetical protein